MATTTYDAVSHGHDEHHHDESDKVLFGFWVYILSDCLLFATLFGTFAVLSNGYYTGGVDPSHLMEMDYVLGETALLLFSSFTFGLVMLAAYKKNLKQVYIWLFVTFLLGAGFLGMELNEFKHFAHEGATIDSNGYWAAFYVLVGTHGFHVTMGLVWILILFALFKRDGLDSKNMIRLSCLSLFWHFLDVIWICVFSFVYLFEVVK